VTVTTIVEIWRTNRTAVSKFIVFCRTRRFHSSADNRGRFREGRAGSAPWLAVEFDIAQRPRISPNVNNMLRLLLVIPVTAATVERSNSTSRYVKNSNRSSSCQERLNTLLLLCIHKYIPLDYSAVVDIFIRRNHRRVTLLNQLE